MNAINTNDSTAVLAEAGYVPGTVVTARPWSNGRRLNTRKGVIVGYALGMVVVWFYGLGEPEAGTSVQAMHAKELTIKGDIFGVSLRTVRAWEKMAVRNENMLGGLKHVIIRARDMHRKLAAMAA